ncbi:unnamed protein product [Diatraea saccharalis]|uniref:phytanoyl-CoA dioxygenase n=1 Tax=Diatraea saccharalis TaxID=40085 RepID=A0A9N9RA97_9NEOP|nr:unnamed protein product [Diatraea saccharalis]
MAKLSVQQIEFYQQNGYLVIGQLLDFETLYSYKKRFLQICNGIVPKGQMTIATEHKLKDSKKKPEDYTNKIQDFLYDDVLSTYAEDPRLLNVVTQLIGDEVSAMHSMFINKPPGTDEHPPHQDLYYFPFRPADKIVAAWTAVDACTARNGCLYVLPRTHRPRRLYTHAYTSIQSKLYHGITDPTVALEKDRVHLEMSPGDTVFFHPYLIHGSGPNITKNYRKSISCHFASNDVTYINVEGTVQEPIAKEVVQEAKRRGLELSYEDIWKYRSKPVKTIKSHL